LNGSSAIFLMLWISPEHGFICLLWQAIKTMRQLLLSSKSKIILAIMRNTSTFSVRKWLLQPLTRVKCIWNQRAVLPPLQMETAAGLLLWSRQVFSPWSTKRELNGSMFSLWTMFCSVLQILVLSELHLPEIARSVLRWCARQIRTKKSV